MAVLILTFLFTHTLTLIQIHFLTHIFKGGYRHVTLHHCVTSAVCNEVTMCKKLLHYVTAMCNISP